VSCIVSSTNELGRRCKSSLKLSYQHIVFQKLTTTYLFNVCLQRHNCRSVSWHTINAFIVQAFFFNYTNAGFNQQWDKLQHRQASGHNFLLASHINNTTTYILMTILGAPLALVLHLFQNRIYGDKWHRYSYSLKGQGDHFPEYMRLPDFSLTFQ